LALHDGLAELGCVPIDNHSGKEIEARHSVMLPFGGSVTDFSLTANPQSIFQRVMRLAFVQANLCTPLHVRIEQPVNDEQSAFDAPDLPKGNSQFWSSPNEVVRLMG